MGFKFLGLDPKEISVSAQEEQLRLLANLNYYLVAGLGYRRTWHNINVRRSATKNLGVMGGWGLGTKISRPKNY